MPVYVCGIGLTQVGIEDRPKTSLIRESNVRLVITVHFPTLYALFFFRPTDDGILRALSKSFLVFPCEYVVCDNVFQVTDRGSLSAVLRVR